MLGSVLLVAGVVAGCGGGGGSDDAQDMTINVGVQSLVLQTYYPQFAEALGYFEDEGITVNISIGESTANSIQGLIGGSIDLYLGGPEGLSANEQGADLRLIAAGSNRSIWNVVTGSGISDLSELNGTAVGVSALQSISTVSMRQALEANGVDGESLDFVVAGGTAKRFAALQAGQVQSVPLGVPVNFQAAQSGQKDWGITNDLGAPPIAAATLTANNSWAAENEEVLQHFLRAYLRVIGALYDPAMTDQMVKIASEGLEVDPEFVRQSITDVFVDSDGSTVPRDGHIDAEALQNAAEAFKEFGGLTDTSNATDILDMSYVEAAYQSLQDDPPA